MGVTFHLGGYVEGGDEATYFPDLWQWLVEEQGVRSVLDVGCGEGHALKFFRELGCTVVGVDGVAQDDSSIDVHDFTAGPYGPIDVDLVWCCEFVEHIEEVYLPNILAALQSAPLVLLTHAEPGQQGHHHVNCQPSSYWVGALAVSGYSLDERLTSLTRVIAGLNTNQYNHYARSGMAFRRNL